MTSLRPSRPLLASLPFAAVIGFAAVAVAQTPQPAPLAPATVAPAPAAPAAPAAAPRKLVLVPTPASEAPVAAPAKAVELAPTPAPAAVPMTVATPAGPVTVAVPAEAAPRNCCEVSRDTIAVWMAKYHPNVVTGGVDAEMVVFVVDNDGHYVTSRVQERRGYAVVDDEKRAAVEKAVMADKVSGEPMTEAQMRELKERKAALEKATVKLDEVKAKIALSDEDKQALEVRRKVEMGMVGVARMKEAGALEGLNVPPESIQSVSVLKVQAGQMAPGPIGIITVFLKP